MPIPEVLGTGDRAGSDPNRKGLWLPAAAQESDWMICRARKITPGFFLGSDYRHYDESHSHLPEDINQVRIWTRRWTWGDWGDNFASAFKIDLNGLPARSNKAPVGSDKQDPLRRCARSALSCAPRSCPTSRWLTRQSSPIWTMDSNCVRGSQRREGPEAKVCGTYQPAWRPSLRAERDYRLVPVEPPCRAPLS